MGEADVRVLLSAPIWRVEVFDLKQSSGFLKGPLARLASGLFTFWGWGAGAITYENF
jgi:hypothetical protein